MNLASRARAFAAEAYGSDEDLAHPTEVATLVGPDDEELWAAAILHDLVEDTDVELPQIGDEFGPRIEALVGAMTEDSSIADYAERKQEHRLRARDAGRDVALLYTADKLSNARRMRRGQKDPDEHKLAHYHATLQMMRDAYPDLLLLDELESELRAREPTTTASAAAANQVSAPAPPPDAHA